MIGLWSPKIWCIVRSTHLWENGSTNPSKLKPRTIGGLKWQFSDIAIFYSSSFFHTEQVVKPVFFACPLFREFREPDKFAKITGRENLNTVAFQCSRKQKRQNYGVQNN